MKKALLAVPEMGNHKELVAVLEQIMEVMGK